MKGFLEYVADDILSKYGTNLSRTAVVFPNKRASLFLSEYIARKAGRPVWSPAYITISDLFRSHSQLTVGDPVKLICELHKSFVRQTGIDETLDHFYGWGQLLIADFDDIDKNMADADKVFANLRDIREFDNVNYLTEKQKEALKRFFSNFSDDHNTLLKERFIKLWSHMGNIYHDFNDSLRTQMLAYEGALYRQVAQQQELDFAYDQYLFVGFNLLQEVEKKLFARIKHQGKARFYWDFDYYYKDTNEAGHFIKLYLDQFPNELRLDDDNIYNCFSGKKQMRFVSAPTENIQARYASQWLRDEDRYKAGRQTAVVMCNEALLQTLIHCLPDEVEKVNVTTGYPLAQSPVASLISQLIALRTTGYSSARRTFRLRYVKAVLRHPYTACLTPSAQALLDKLKTDKTYYPASAQLSVDEGTALLFHPFDSQTFNAELLQWLTDVMQLLAKNGEQVVRNVPLFQEAVFRSYTLLNRLKGLVDAGDLCVDIITLQRVIGQIIQSTTIPFHGEPIEGIQIMGVLETRNIDFKHVLLLSCNEGNMPRGVSDTSFIPYTIRKAFGLTTIDHKVSIYSYYFHRLLQRADDITILYNNATNDGQRSEMSRFMLQLMVESGHPIEFKTITASQHYCPFKAPTVTKDSAVMKALSDRFIIADDQPADHPLLTPTAINVYQRCPVAFYYKYVKSIREPDDTDDDSIDNRLFGNIFHEAARLIYSRLMQKGPLIRREALEMLLKTKVDIERAVDEAFRTELFHVQDAVTSFHAELNGLQLINREVIIHYLSQLLSIDCQLAPFSILALEEDVKRRFDIVTNGTNRTTVIGGRIDRLDKVNDANGERIRVIDYKTGGKKIKALTGVDDIFDHSKIKDHNDYYLQTFLYSCLVKNEHPDTAVSPALLFIQHAGAADYDPTLLFGKELILDVEDYRKDFEKRLHDIVNELFCPDVPFSPTDDLTICQKCPYLSLCRNSKRDDK